MYNKECEFEIKSAFAGNFIPILSSCEFGNTTGFTPGDNLYHNITMKGPLFLKSFDTTPDSSALITM